MPVKVKESAVEKELIARVRARGGIAEKVTVLGARGFFDRLVILPGGRVIFVEIKRPHGGIVSAHQILRAQRYRALGVEAVLVKDVADLDRLMNEEKIGRGV